MVLKDLPNGVPSGGQPNGLGSAALDSPSEWVIQKFGGTSVGKFALNIVDKVVKCVWYSLRAFNG